MQRQSLNAQQPQQKSSPLPTFLMGGGIAAVGIALLSMPESPSLALSGIAVAVVGLFLQRQ
jgi:hypothetical protein